MATRHVGLDLQTTCGGLVGVNSRCRGPPIQVVFRPASLINFSGHMFAWLYSLTICVVITSIISWNLEQNKRLQRQGGNRSENSQTRTGRTGSRRVAVSAFLS